MASSKWLCGPNKGNFGDSRLITSKVFSILFTPGLIEFTLVFLSGLEEEAQVGFHEHVFLEPHLKPWCPARGPIRHFMELIIVGLSKNPYLTVAQKKDHISWFRDFFESKRSILVETGAIPDAPPAPSLSTWIDMVSLWIYSQHLYYLHNLTFLFVSLTSTLWDIVIGNLEPRQMKLKVRKSRNVKRIEFETWPIELLHTGIRNQLASIFLLH